MPIYEYVCGECRHEFEALVRGSETPHCAACGGQNLTKLLSVPAAHTASTDVAGCPMPGGSEMCGRGGCGFPQCQM